MTLPSWWGFPSRRLPISSNIAIIIKFGNNSAAEEVGELKLSSEQRKELLDSVVNYLKSCKEGGALSSETCMNGAQVCLFTMKFMLSQQNSANPLQFCMASYHFIRWFANWSSASDSNSFWTRRTGAAVKSSVRKQNNQSAMYYFIFPKKRQQIISF